MRNDIDVVYDDEYLRKNFGICAPIYGRRKPGVAFWL